MVLAIKVKSGHFIKCPVHGLHVVPNSWQCNGTPECPDFKPSVRHFIEPNETWCHYFITNGNIVFCSDNPHDKNGQILPLEPFTNEEIELYNSEGYQK